MASRDATNADMASKSEPTTPEDTRDMFPFFDLPRELRDMIYEYCVLDEIQLPEDRTGLDEDELNLLDAKLSIEMAPLVQLLCANRQVKQEYEKAVNCAPILVIGDNDEFELEIPNLADSRLPRIERVEFRLVAHCQSSPSRNIYLADELDSFIDFINKVILHPRLSDLKTVALSIGIAKSGDGDVPKWPEGPWEGGSDELLKNLNDLVTIKKVCKVEVYWCGAGTLQPVESEDLWVTWVKKSGWKAPDEDE